MAPNDHNPASMLRYLADHALTGEQRPLGLTVTTDEPHRWTITVFTPRHDTNPVLTADFGPTDIGALLELDRQHRFHWICHDLTATATLLPVRSGYCLTLAERALRNYHRTDTAVTGSTPAEMSLRYAEIQRLIRLSQHPEELITLLDLDSASAIAAGRMTATGVPWDNDTYLQILHDRLGTSTADDTYPALTKLDNQITMRFGGARFRWNHELPDAFDGEDITLTSSCLDDLARLHHPAVPLILQWRELDTLATRHGYRWAAEWTTDGRWWPHWHPAGTPSGRWSGHGGALQLPACLRRCVRAQPGRVIVAADFAQLDPRIWAHLSGDPHLTAIQGDLYQAVAHHLSIDRDKAKTALLAALYGQRIGCTRDIAGMLTRAFPRGMAYLRAITDRAARDEPIRTRLARTLPPPDPDTAEALATPYRDRTAAQRSAVAHRNREAANFVIAGTATELATATLAALRRRLAGLDAHLVMFVHDEFVLDVADDNVEDVALAIRNAAADGTRQILGQHLVPLPISIGCGPDWASAKP